MNWMTSYADGHGGIHEITWVDSGTAGDGQTHTATIHYADTTTSTFVVKDGYKGDKGDTWYTYIKYASDLPTDDGDIGDNPDNYIGLYTGAVATAPEHYSDYEWFQWKGDKGDTGDAATITAQSVGYLTSASGTTPPEGQWATTVPAVAQGEFLWTRTTIAYNTGDIVTAYSVARSGIDGAGSVSAVNTVSPDSGGNVSLTANDIPTSDTDSVQDHITQIETNISSIQDIRHYSGTITAFPIVFSYTNITSDHRVINCSFGTPSALLGDVSWTTAAGSVTFSGTLASGSSTTIDFDITKPETI